MHPFAVALFITLLWVGLTIFLARVGVREGNIAIDGLQDYNTDSLQKTALAMILSTLVTVLSITFLLPLLFHVNTFGAMQWVHHVGVVLLGIFLATSLYLQVEIRGKIGAAADIHSVQRSYRNWRNITELMPAPAALMVLGSGFGLLYAKPGYSINRGWIFVLILILAVMMSDGIFGYTFDVRRLLHSADVEIARSGTTKSFSLATSNGLRDLKLIAHSLSFPIVVVFPALKIWNDHSPASPALRAIGLRDVGGWPQLWPALVLFVVPFLLVASLNRFGRSTVETSI